MNSLVIRDLTLNDLPVSWVKQFHLSQEAYFTVHIVVQAKPVPRIFTQENRQALMSVIAQELSGMGVEDSEDWIRRIKATRTISKPTQPF